MIGDEVDTIHADIHVRTDAVEFCTLSTQRVVKKHRRIAAVTFAVTGNGAFTVGFDSEDTSQTVTNSVVTIASLFVAADVVLGVAFVTTDNGRVAAVTRGTACARRHVAVGLAVLAEMV